ncbi:MAG: hypothetical protein ACREQC_01835 [Candidatus Binataceae bacterium]
MKKPTAVRALPALALMVAALAVVLAPTRASAAVLDFRMADFRILNAATAAPIGKVHYDVSDGPAGVQIVTSDARYTDGQHDIERDEIDTRDALPIMIRYEHTFFRTDGALLKTSKADLATGLGDCTSYENGKPVVASKTFAFPKDTYAGAGIMLPLQESLRLGTRGPIVMHYFVCVPGPKLVKIDAYAKPPGSWEHYPGKVVRAVIKPDFGWLNYLIAPFLPEMYAWFNADADFPLVGGQFSKFYKGPEIIIAREQSATADQHAARDTRAEALR